MDNNLQNNNYNTDWSHLNQVGSEVHEASISPEEQARQKKSFFFKFFIASIILLLIAGVYAGVRYYLGKNTISNDKISLNINLDDNVKGGQPGKMGLSIQNNNSLPLLGAKVTVKTQKGFSKDGVIDQDIKTYNFGNIEPNVYTSTTTEYVFNGQEGDKRKVSVTLEYSVQGSNSPFKKDAIKEVKIISPSAIVTIDGSREIIEDYDYAYKFKVKNVSYNNGESLMLSVTPPAGFVVEQNASNSDPTKFVIKGLAIGETKEYSVKGRFKSVLTNATNFVAALSTYDGQNAKSMISESHYEVSLISAPVSYNYKLSVFGGESKFLEIGKPNSVKLTIKNISDNYVSDVVVMVNAADKAFTFNKVNSQTLDRINPGEERELEMNGVDLPVGNTKASIEIYGKTRNQDNTILLKRGAIDILTR